MLGIKGYLSHDSLNGDEIERSLKICCLPSGEIHIVVFSQVILKEVNI